MRKFRKVHVIVSENFYNQLDQGRAAVHKKSGLKKNISFPSYTELLAQNIRIPSLNIRGGFGDEFGKKRRRY